MGQKGRDKRHGSRKRRIPVTHYAAVRIFFSSRSPVCQVFVSTQHHYSNNCVESLLQPYIQPTILKFENFFFFFTALRTTFKQVSLINLTWTLAMT